MKKRKERFDTYIVALTERFEVEIRAWSRKDAMARVTQFGGNVPTWHRVTARLKNRRVGKKR